MTLRIYWTALKIDRASGLGLKPRNLYSKQNVAGKGSNEFVGRDAYRYAPHPARRKNSREHEKPALSRWLIGFVGILGRGRPESHVPRLFRRLLFANRNQFICVIDGAG